MCPVTVLTHVYQTAQCHFPAGQTGHCSKQLRSQPQADNDPFWIFYRQPDKLLTHTTIRYLNLQYHINQILAEISRTCCVSHKLRHEVLKRVIMMLLITLVQPLLAGRYVTSSERNLPPLSSWWWRWQMLWNVGAYLPDCTVPQLRIFLVSDQFGVHKTNSNNWHIYTFSKLHLIQSIRVTHYAQGWDMSTWEFRIWSPCHVRML